MECHGSKQRRIVVNELNEAKRLRSIQDLRLVADHCTHVLSLFSGGLDSTYVLSRLADKTCRITALTVDLGDGVDRADLRRLTSHFGAELLVIDGREMFAEKAVLPSILANARYMGMYPISASLSRPIIARLAVTTAMELGCDAIIHTANQSQNTLRRLNGALDQLGYRGFSGTPYEYSPISREQKIIELAAAGLEQFHARGISGDANLWCREFESGSLDNPERFSIPEHLLRWTAPGNMHRFAPAISVDFQAGRPVALNGHPRGPCELIAELNQHAGAFGIGRYSGLEHLEHGEKVLEVREAPAASLLMEAFRHLETATLDAEVLREKLAIEQLWVREAIEGRWYGPLKAAAESFMSETAKQITGRVEFQLRAGAADVCSIRAASPRYLTDREHWEFHAAHTRGRRELVLPARSQADEPTAAVRQVS